MVKNHISARGQRNKTDRQDALAIADYVVKHEPPQWQPLRPEQQEVKELNQVLIELQEDLQRSKNRLPATPSRKTRREWEKMVNKITCQLKKLEEKVHQNILADEEISKERKLYLILDRYSRGVCPLGYQAALIYATGISLGRHRLCSTSFFGASTSRQASA